MTPRDLPTLTESNRLAPRQPAFRTAWLLWGCLFLVWGCAAPTPPPPLPENAEASRLAQQAIRRQTQADWTGAATWWERAGQQYRLLNQLTNVAVAWHNEALCRTELGQTNEARALLEHAAQLNRSLELTNAWWRNQIALLQLDQSAAPGRGAQRLESLERETPPDDPRTLAVWHHEKARAELAEGATTPAWQDLLDAAALFSKLEDPSALAAVHMSQARTLSRQGKLPAAENTWRTALGEYEKLAEPRGIALALAGLGTCLAAEGQHPSEARELLQRALQNFHTLKMEAEAQGVEVELSRLQAKGPGNPGS